MFRSILRNASEKSDVNTDPTGFYHDTPINDDGDIPRTYFGGKPRHHKVNEYWAGEGKKAKAEEPPRDFRLTFGETFAVHFELRSPPSAVRSVVEISPVEDGPELVDFVAAKLTPIFIRDFGLREPEMFKDAWSIFKLREGSMESATPLTLVERVLEIVEKIHENGECHLADLEGEPYVNPCMVEKKYERLVNDVLDEPAKEGHELTPAQELCMDFSEELINIKPRQMLIPHNPSKKAVVDVNSTTVKRAAKVAAGLHWLLESPESPARQA